MTPGGFGLCCYRYKRNLHHFWDKGVAIKGGDERQCAHNRAAKRLYNRRQVKSAWLMVMLPWVSIKRSVLLVGKQSSFTHNFLRRCAVARPGGTRALTSESSYRRSDLAQCRVCELSTVQTLTPQGVYPHSANAGESFGSGHTALSHGRSSRRCAPTQRG